MQFITDMKHTASPLQRPACWYHCVLWESFKVSQYNIFYCKNAELWNVKVRGMCNVPLHFSTFVRFSLLRLAVTLKISLVWEVTPCSVVEVYRHFGGFSVGYFLSPEYVCAEVWLGTDCSAQMGYVVVRNVAWVTWFHVEGTLEEWFNFWDCLLSYDAVVEVEKLDIIIFQYVHPSTFGGSM